MLVEVVRKNKSVDQVEESQLAALIDANEIIAFRRAEGWVEIGEDPIRVRHVDRHDHERRKGK